MADETAPVHRVFSPTKLKEAMDAAGRQVEDLARETGVSKVSAGRWLAGTRTPKLSNLQRLAAFLGRPLSALLEDEAKAQLSSLSLNYLEDEPREASFLGDWEALTADERELVEVLMRVLTRRRPTRRHRNGRAGLPEKEPRRRG